jgi:hypothetical protein
MVTMVRTRRLGAAGPEVRPARLDPDVPVEETVGER